MNYLSIKTLISDLSLFEAKVIKYNDKIVAEIKISIKYNGY